MLIPVILSGGSGTRLWPLSRELYPKQLLPLVGKGTMLQETLARVSGVEDVTAPIVVCNESHRFLVAEQLLQAGVQPQAILLEPVGRNTAPAVAVAAMAALAQLPEDTQRGNDPLLLILPADHVIRDVAAFQAALAVGRAQAQQGRLVTFGVVPTQPETGYGYIRRGGGEGAGSDERPGSGGGPAFAEDLAAGKGLVSSQGSAFDIAEFVEKPDLATARGYLASGEYYWNSGMFMFRASKVLEELRALAPQIYQACTQAYTGACQDLDFTRLPAREFGACPSDSFDYAVMEKTAHGVVVPLDAGWSDVGSWSALHAAIPADAEGNVRLGDVLTADTSGCYLHSTSRLVATVGLQDHVVVETKDAVLVAPKARVQDVKELVNQLKKQDRHETSLHREVFRPWGSYDSIDHGDRFQVKRLVVKPGATLSLQLHHHRAEHWIVVAGTARITRGEETFLLEENQSTYIPLGTRHRIENPGRIPLHIIEVQSGTYLGEDDIVRFEDRYGREGQSG
ncbi:mannose-1-phosphate guanyltransferase [Steroidobacter denitrificans]|uniref:mannose-1-phosphate guanylyltransferase n=1 Tax=Steroidobacter denitrificans TaxID=465721 RepID=A0A127F7P3_STEDE|nr:mannose-1-phosphate guanylyltransferase/mannose-6-phosphate isomerase [Steroidobacter denitrificans]AMN46444.1 mannose-1-phosphate guanyltransferase [Steroidobacter denitrificans]